MQIIPRRELPRLLRAAGLDPHTREFPDVPAVHRLTVREREPRPHIRGPHRKIVYPDGRMEGPIPVADRPALSAFVAAAFTALEVEAVLAVVAEGTFWLNNKAQAAYLAKVADARYVCQFLRRRGLTDRFQGGFCVRRARFSAVLPVLAANTFAGGGDVLFAALSPVGRRLTILACHHYDLHFAAPDPAPLESIADLAAQHGLEPETLALPDLPALWGSE
ncbi:MAG TPA: hypothetical protein VFB38_27360 [Chthonomonadaceae bacterium]|nr:hypothetical protein [Chthonomonadaceae bacterium]